MQHLQSNTILQGGKYKIERVLGQGGFGITYLAVQVSLNRHVAIKELFIGGEGQAINDRKCNMVVVTNSANQASFNQQKEKFKKEALRLANLSHPNLVKVHELFEENGTAYYVMDYIDGESLRTKLNREGRLSESLVLNYLQQLLPALEVAHSQNIWHLDIKPENIMVDRQGHAYLIDFGASKHIERSSTLTTSLALAYTPGYCASELTDLIHESQDGFAEALREIGPWTDIYSLGATLYNLLTDNIPQSAKRIERNGRNAFIFPSGISSSTQDLIVWMMKPNREDRPQNVSVIRSKLLNYQQGSTIGSFANIEKQEHKGHTKTNSCTNSDEAECTIYERNGRTENHLSSVSLSLQSSTNSSLPPKGKGNSILWVFLIIAFLIFIIIFYGKNSNKSSSPEITSGLITNRNPIMLKGKINNKIGFTMHLTIDGNIIEGTEHYDNQKKDAIVNIKGSIDDNGTMTLNEYDGNNKTGYFEGVFEKEVFSGTFTNRRGKKFDFSANVTENTTSDNAETEITGTTTIDDEFALDLWSGKLIVYGGIYRNCDSCCSLELEKVGKDSYRGKIELHLGYKDDMLRFNADRGSLYGNVRGKSSGNTITIVLDDFTTDDPDEHIAYGEIEAGKQIFRFEYNNSTYTVEPLGKMGYYFDGMTENTVVKI